MYREGNNALRYIFAYFLCSMCLFALFATEIYGDPTAHNGDPGTYLQQEQPTESHTKVNGGTSAHKGDTSNYHQQQKIPTKDNTKTDGDTLALNGQPHTNPHFQKPTKRNTKIHKDTSAHDGEPDADSQQQRPTKIHTQIDGDTLPLNSQPDTNSHFQKPTKRNMEIHRDTSAPNGEPDADPQRQKPTKSHTQIDGDMLPLNDKRDPYSQQPEPSINSRTTKTTHSAAVSRRRAKRLKTRSLTLPGEISLSDIPELEVSTSGSPVSSSSTMSNKTLSEALSRAASNGSGVTRETVPVDFTAISVVPSEEAFPKELPLPLLIASPVAAVSIIIFVCVAYYCHSNQLDARARQLALKYAVISTEPPACGRGIPSTSSVDMDLIRKTSLRPSTSRTSTPTPTPNGSKRGSMNWVAIGDQEVITYTAARRHSTFIL